MAATDLMLSVVSEQCVVDSKPAAPQPETADSPFDRPAADVVLQSSDKVNF